MEHFYFNLRHGPGPGGLAVDPEGDALPDVAAAHTHALKAACDLIAHTRSDSVPDWFTCAFEIVDGAGRPVLTVPFGDTVDEDPDED